MLLATVSCDASTPDTNDPSPMEQPASEQCSTTHPFAISQSFTNEFRITVPGACGALGDATVDSVAVEPSTEECAVREALSKPPSPSPSSPPSHSGPDVRNCKCSAALVT